MANTPHTLETLGLTPDELNTARQEVSARAYKIWEDQGYPSGTHDEDWLRAEQEYIAECQASSQTSQQTRTAKTTARSATATN